MPVGMCVGACYIACSQFHLNLTEKFLSPNTRGIAKVLKYFAAEILSYPPEITFSCQKFESI